MVSFRKVPQKKKKGRRKYEYKWFIHVDISYLQLNIKNIKSFPYCHYFQKT